jgi:hypothetical protein
MKAYSTPTSRALMAPPLPRVPMTPMITASSVTLSRSSTGRNSQALARSSVCRDW